MKKRIPAFFIITIIFALSTGIKAQEEISISDLYDMSLEELVNVTITTASKSPQKISEVPFSVTIVTRTDIDNWNAKTIVDVLRFIPGFYVENFSGHLNTVSIRGFYPTSYSKSALLLLVDGRPTNDIDFGNADFLLSTRNIKQIEIIRGPGSALYGANAFLGVINVITLDASNIMDKQNYGLRSDLRLGQNGMIQAGINTAKKLSEEFSVYSGIEFSKQDKLVDKYYGLENSFQLRSSKNDNVQNIDIFIKATYKDLIFSSGFNTRDNQVPVHFGNPYFVDKERTARLFSFADITYNIRIDTSTSFKIKSYINYNKVDEELQDYRYDLFMPDPNVRKNNVDEHRLGLESQITSSFRISGFKNKILAGIEIRKEDVNYHNSETAQPGIYELKEISNFTTGLFLQDVIELTENLHLFLGTRFDFHSKYGNNISPRLSAIYSPKESNFILRANYAEAFKAPSFHQLYNHKIDVDFVSPTDSLASGKSLKPEGLKSFEIGGSYSIEKMLTTDLAFFLVEAKNELASFVSIFNPPFYFYNDSETNKKSIGVEFSIRAEKRVGDYTFSPIANATYSQVKQTDSKSFFTFNGSNANYRSNLKSNIGFHLDFQNFLYSDFFFHYLPEFKTETGKKPGSYSDYSVGIKNSIYDFKLGIKNILNQTYYESESIQLNRYFWLELRFKL